MTTIIRLLLLFTLSASYQPAHALPWQDELSGDQGAGLPESAPGKPTHFSSPETGSSVQPTAAPNLKTVPRDQPLTGSNLNTVPPDQPTTTPNLKTGSSDQPTTGPNLKTGASESGSHDQSTSASGQDNPSTGQAHGGTEPAASSRKLAAEGPGTPDANDANEAPPSVPTGELHKAQMRLSGSMCYSCLLALKKKIDRVDGIELVKVDKAAERISHPSSPDLTSYADAVVIYDSAKVNLQDLRSYIRSNGYMSFKVKDQLLDRPLESFKDRKR